MTDQTHKIDRTGWAYVGLPPGHRLHGRDCVSAEDAPALDVHGGITYANACAGPICHVPREGEPADVWWLGFDCAHAFDYVPGLYGPAERLRRLVGTMRRLLTYRSLAYVRAEVESLAEQLRALA